MMAPMITSVILLIAFSVCRSESSLYNEIQSLNASCSSLDSCSALYYPKHDHLWNGRLCECGYHCIRFGTCCPDSEHVGKKDVFILQKHELCQTVENMPVPVMMIAKCAEGWQWPEDVVSKCENSEFTMDDHFLWSVPITNAETLKTYRSYYCALCNYGGRNFLYWNVHMTTNVTSEIHNRVQEDMIGYLDNHILYESNKKSWVLSDQQYGEFYDLDVQYVLPSYLRRFVKPCHPNLVQTCKSSHATTELENKCLSYYSPIKIKTGEGVSVYRNVHCALCNDVDSSLIGREECTPQQASPAERKLLAFVLDVNQNAGDMVGMRGVPVPDCDKHGEDHPLSQTCKNIVCGVPGSVMDDGPCEKNYNY